MKCPKCGSTNTLQLKADLGENKSGHVCECGYQWVYESKSLFQQLKECETPEEMAELFVWSNGFVFGSDLIEHDRYFDRKNAVKDTAKILKRER